MDHLTVPNLPNLPAAGAARERRRQASPQTAGHARDDPIGEPSPGLDLRPGCVYGVVTRERANELAAELAEIKSRLNQLFALIVGGIVVDVLLRIAGLG